VNEVLALSGTEQARLVREGKISSAELIAAHLARIEEINPALNAVVEILHTPARQIYGPLAGVPFSVKDSIEVEGTVCSAGTLGYRNRPPSARDATLVERLRKAGAIPIAHTNVPDLLFAFESDNLIFGRTNNPYDLSRTPGGSSGGEAALIAACGSPLGLGSDAAGSVRLPAHYCGIASLKPTSGCLPRDGHVPPAAGWIEMLWQIGPMARKVEDLVTMMPILLGEGRRQFSEVSSPRIAFFTDNGIIPADAATAGTIRTAAKALAAEGLIVEESRPSAIEQSYDLEMKLLGADGGDGLRQFLADVGSDRTHSLLDGWLRKLEPYRTNLAGFSRYWAELDHFRAEMAAFLSRYDAIISPVAAQPAVHHGMSIADDIFPGFSYTMTHNLTGWPAAVVRCGVSRAGLPVGVQIAAAPWREDVALQVAGRLEGLLGGWQRPITTLSTSGFGISVAESLPIQG
jgi:amidase